MTKSTITREQLLEIIETDHVQCGEASYLSSMALAAMDSESEYLPLDYLQGHKDGLEWAAQLAEANHPETGDWLYDDPIELAKAIRKGPDMPPVQPVADSEPVAYMYDGEDGREYNGHNEFSGGGEGIPLYRHAQPAQVVPETAHSSVIAEQLANVLSDMKVTGHQRAVINCAVDRLNNVAQLLQLSPSALLVPEILDYQGAKELYNYLMTEEETNATVNAWNACRAAMLQELQKSAGASNNCRSNENVQDLQAGNSPAQGGSRCSIKAAPALDSSPKTADARCGNSPVILNGSASMLRRWLAFGRGMQNAGSQLPHNLIAETESMLAAAQHDTPALNSLQSVDSVVGRWVPVSERMPEGSEEVLCAKEFDGPGDWRRKVGYLLAGKWTVYGASWTPTHWMPLPAAPQEVNHG